MGFTVLHLSLHLQAVFLRLGWFTQRCMGTSYSESLVAAANIFLGQTEAPLLVKPFVAKLTQSELHAVPREKSNMFSLFFASVGEVGEVGGFGALSPAKRNPCLGHPNLVLTRGFSVVPCLYFNQANHPKLGLCNCSIDLLLLKPVPLSKLWLKLSQQPQPMGAKLRPPEPLPIGFGKPNLLFRFGFAMSLFPTCLGEAHESHSQNPVR